MVVRWAEKTCLCLSPLLDSTDYGRLMKPFLSKWAWADNLENLGALGVISNDLRAPILEVWVPCPSFSLINHYFYKKLSLYIQIPNMFWDWDLNLVCKEFRHRVSVARAQFYSALFRSLSIKSYATMTVLSWFFFFLLRWVLSDWFICSINKDGCLHYESNCFVHEIVYHVDKIEK